MLHWRLGGGSWPILRLFRVLLSTYGDQLGGCLEQPWLFFQNLGVLFGLLDPCWDNINCGNPKAPPVESPPDWDAPWGGTGNWSAPWGGHEPQAVVHIYEDWCNIVKSPFLKRVAPPFPENSSRGHHTWLIDASLNSLVFHAMAQPQLLFVNTEGFQGQMKIDCST